MHDLDHYTLIPQHPPNHRGDNQGRDEDYRQGLEVMHGGSSPGC